MTSWQDLMDLSAAHTEQTAEAVKSALADRQRREAQKRKEQAEKEKREREQEAKLRLKRLEEGEREKERIKRLEQERQAKERNIEQRAKQERDALLYGPKKAKDSQGYPTSGAAKRKHFQSDEDESGSSHALTREEKRQRRLDAELRDGRSTTRRAMAGGGGYGKAGRRLPGGAVDITTTAASPSSSQASPRKQSVRERLAAQPAMLIKLNTNKRDTRTIDEILQDRAKARQSKILDGESARDFNDWFGKAKKEAPKKTSPPTSRANTPAVNGGSESIAPTASGSASPTPFPPTAKSHSASKPSPLPRPGSSKVTSNMKASVPKIKSAPGAANPSASSSSRAESFAATSKSITKKRSSSSSVSSAVPSNDISSEIWKLFGKDRSSYIERDVFSDEEDMEADAFDVEKEELRSARLAKKEDELALEEERRHEEEKRRRKKEKRGHH